MENKDYIEHEIKLRVHDEQFKILHGKLNLLIGTGLTGVIVPVILHLLRLI